MEAVDMTRLNSALNTLSKLYRAAKAERLAELGLHPGQDVLLWLLAEADSEGGMTISALASRLGIEPATATRSLARLERSGLFSREPVPGDRRQVRIRLTDRGRELVPVVERIWDDLAVVTTSSLAPDEGRALVGMLDRANDGLREVIGDRAARSVLVAD